MKTEPIENDFAAQSEYGETMEAKSSELRRQNRLMRTQLRIVADYLRDIHRGMARDCETAANDSRFD